MQNLAAVFCAGFAINAYAATVTVNGPNGGENWTGGSTQSITWAVGGTTTNIAYFKIALSTNGGASYSTDLTPNGIFTPSNRSWSWAISSSLATSQARIRVRALASDSTILAEDTSNANFTISGAAVAPTVTVNGPNGGENWPAGSTQSVGWTVAGTTTNIAYFKIALSTDGGASYSTDLTPNGIFTPSSRSWSWAISSSLATSQARIRVRALASDSTILAEDASNANFTVSAPAVAPTVTVNAPNVGENWTAGSMQSVSWTVSGTTANIAYFKIALSTDGGASYSTDLTPNGIFSPSSRSWSWAIVSSLATTQARIRVRALASDSTILAEDASNANFTVSTPAVAPTVTVNGPNGGESWTAGSTESIGWIVAGTTTNIAYFKIALSTDGGASYSTDLTPNGIFTPSSRSWSWAIASSLATTQARIRVRALASDSTILAEDASNANFTISVPSVAPTVTVNAPNGGENWAAGSTESIGWTVAGTTANIAYFKIALSTDGGASYSTDLTPNGIFTPSSRSWSWVISSSLVTSQARIRVRALASDATILAEDVSNANFTVTGASTAALAITTASLVPATATVGTGYAAQQAVAATGGQPPYAWTASGLPSGMGINSSSGAVFGTPTVAGTFNFTVTVHDSGRPQKTDSKTLTISVTGASTSTLSITTTSLSPATAIVGTAYAAQQAVAATGGQTPYTWSASGLPNGMGINSSSGAVFGTPTVAGTFNLTVTVQDNSSPQKTDSKTLTISVSGASTSTLSITTSSLSPATATVGTAYVAQQAVTAIGGQTPYTWSASGLPDGMGINSSSGAIFGTPTVAGTFNFTVTVHDSSSPQRTDSKALSIIVSGASTPALSITTTSLSPATATVGTVYAAQQAVAATGGQIPYSWSAVGLPAGMAINASSGAVFGTPTVTGTSNFTVTVTDSSVPQKTASRTLSITVASSTTAPVLAVSPESVTLEASASGGINFAVSNAGGGTMKWYGAVTSGSWLTPPAVTTGVNNDTLRFTFTPNSGDERTATVTFTAPDAVVSSVIIKVSQRGVNTTNAIGVDVYAGNGPIPWSSANVQFAYLKATESNYSPDALFTSHVAGIGQRMFVGAYHFATPLFSATYHQPSYDHLGSARDEAVNYWTAAKNVIGHGFLPPALDVEEQVVTWTKTSSGRYTAAVYVDPLSGASHDPSGNPLPRQPAMPTSALAQWILDWMAALQELQVADGRTPVAPVLYCSRDYAKQLYPYLKGKIRLWIADWSNPLGKPDTTGFSDWSWLFHQYSSRGTFVGLSPIDLDVFNGDSAALAALVNGGSSTAAAAYTITPSAGSNGSITPSTAQVIKAGEKVTFTAIPASGRVVDQWSINNNPVQSGGTTFTVGAPSSNQTVLVTFKPANLSAGTYQGLLNDGAGVWGLNIEANGMGTYIAYLSQRGSVIVQPVAVDGNGRFTSTTTEIRPAASLSGFQVANDWSSPTPGRAAAETTITISGQVVNGMVVGQMEGTGFSFTAAADRIGPAQSWAGFYSASAVTIMGGTTYTVVGSSGQAVVVTTTPTSVDGGTATVDSSGRLSATTVSGTKVTATIDPSAQTISAAITAPGGSGVSSTQSGVSSAVVVSNRLINISARGVAGTNTQALIAGFVIKGATSKLILIRAIGPALSDFGVAGTLASPKLQLFRGDGSLLTENVGWTTAANSGDVQRLGGQVGAFPLTIGSRDSALLVTLDSGSYTAVASGADGGGGVALVEVYEAASSNDSPKLINISTRGQVNTDSGVLIAGFVITGNSPKRVLIRAIGPTLLSYNVTGALVDPVLSLFDSNSTQIAQNDNWGASGDGNAIAVASAQVGAFGLSPGTKDAVLLVTLQPGSYTAQAAGVARTTGVALLEVYEIP